MKTNYFSGILLLIAMTFNISAEAKIWRVNNSPGCSGWTNVNHKVFNSLPTAVEQASATDTLYVEGSTIAYEAVTITKKLTIIGTGYFLEQNLNLQHNSNTSKVESITFGAGSDGSVISGIETTGAVALGYNTVYLSNNALDNITITRCKLGQIVFQNVVGVSNSNITITKNYISQFAYRPESLGGNGPINNFILRNNYIGVLGLNNDFSGAVTQNVIEGNVNIFGIQFYNNIVLGSTINQNATNSISNIHHNIFDFPRPTYLQGETTNFFSLAPEYLFANQSDTADNKFKLKTQASNLCPECYLGFASSPQIGMYGGLDPYIVSGIPNIPTIYLLQAPAEANPASNLGVSISTRRND